MHYVIIFVTCQVTIVALYVVDQVCGRGYTKSWVIFLDKKHSKNYKYLGLNISYYRKEKGLSQMQLAEMINISRTHMSRIETADCAVSLDVVFDICDALSIIPAKLFDFRID